MKKILILMLLTLISCDSGNLTNSKAQKIIELCLEKKPLQRTVQLQINKTRFYKSQIKELLPKYEKLQEKGLLEIKSLEKNKRKFEVTITESGKKLIEELREGSNFVLMRSHKYEVDEVLEVIENPMQNTAVVKVQYKAIDITPFSILNRSDMNEFIIQDIKMIKTSNGWKYCDNY
ncbi:hypothetical protein KORDIASMS9_02041 [Kordia sp. SMS9]|uniref:hypothetical protein n=1 Tax=Kordia sp. SMS9 TaxID=2282170 RepID=UPI000E0CEDAD|nr:hypothetical protein [Kordia sp. SMS9]AXG69813.1 hypothetical protein KORDIASMS9_02041 [Kordia sp. SMS9]